MLQVLHKDQKEHQPNGGQGKRSFFQHMTGVFSQGKQMLGVVNAAVMHSSLQQLATAYASIMLFACVRI